MTIYVEQESHSTTVFRFVKLESGWVLNFTLCETATDGTTMFFNWGIGGASGRNLWESLNGDITETGPGRLEMTIAKGILLDARGEMTIKPVGGEAKGSWVNFHGRRVGVDVRNNRLEISKAPTYVASDHDEAPMDSDKMKRFQAWEAAEAVKEKATSKKAASKSKKVPAKS